MPSSLGSVNWKPPKKIKEFTSRSGKIIQGHCHGHETLFITFNLEAEKEVIGLAHAFRVYTIELRVCGIRDI